MVTKVKFNTQNENAFYGMTNTLQLFQSASKGIAPNVSMLESAWDECEDINQKAVLFSILFSIGDVTSRQHNVFEVKAENGGNSERAVFRDTIVPFMVKKVDEKHHITLMNLITEYTVMDNVLAHRVQTKTKTTNVQKVINMIDVFGLETVVFYCSTIINNGTDFQKACLAKFLTRPRQSKRAGNTKMLPETQKIMEQRVLLLKGISESCSLAYEDKGNYIDFSGYYNWRKPYIEKLESVLFSTKAILEFDKEEFLAWLNIIPSDARFRVKKKVFYSKNADETLKWKQQALWFKEWESFKEVKQQEQRVLETKISQGVASDSDLQKLKEVKKQAKVTSGATNFIELFSKIIKGSVDELTIQPFLDKVNLPYNTLTFIDDSGSMNWGSHNGFYPRDLAAFIATICMMKNPDSNARDVVGLFNSDCRMFNGIVSKNTAPNSLLKGQIRTIQRQPLIRQEEPFLSNLARFRGFLNAESTGRGTDISSVFRKLHAWASLDNNNLEELQKYPVWTFISDGNFNNRYGATASMLDFIKKMETKLGFKPFIILIDVAHNTSQNIQNFEGIDNIMMVPPNPASIELFLTNFRDMDTFDVYTPLQSVYRSKRYGPIREFAFSLEESVKEEAMVV